MNKLVVLTDLGSFKAYRLEDDRSNSRPRLQPVDAYETSLGDHRIGRRLSDQAGNFQKRGAMGMQGVDDGETGERHNICLENDKRSVKEIAERMNELLSNGDFESCYFAASNEINRDIVNHLSPQAKAKIEKNLTCNLVNAPHEELLNHFK